MKPKVWNALIAGTTALFLALFFYAQEYFVKHHLIPVSFAVLGALWMLGTYDAYKSGNASKLRLYGGARVGCDFHDHWHLDGCCG